MPLMTRIAGVPVFITVRDNVNGHMPYTEITEHIQGNYTELPLGLGDHKPLYPKSNIPEDFTCLEWWAVQDYFGELGQPIENGGLFNSVEEYSDLLDHYVDGAWRIRNRVGDYSISEIQAESDGYPRR